MSHVSHWMAACPLRHAREQTPQGNFAGRGPGLVSRSPDSIRSEQIKEDGESDLTCRAKLLLK